MVKSSYNEDKRKEELFAKWLDKHFYPTKERRSKKITRIYDEKIQKLGIDVIAEHIEGGIFCIDEKATLHYINQNIPTFAFEILNSTSGRKGWLFNPDYKTNCYLLAWPFANDLIILNEDSFTKAYIVLIARKRVIELLKDNGLTEKTILDYVNKYKNQVTSSKNKFKINKDISLNFNTTLAERPINIVIHRSLLERYAIQYGMYPLQDDF